MQLLLDARTEKLNSNELDDSTDLTNITIQKSLSNEVNFLKKFFNFFNFIKNFFFKEVQGIN